MRAAYDYWLFDLDGTIVDVEREYAREVICRAGERLDIQFSPQQADCLWYGLGGSPEMHLRQWGIDAEGFWEAFHAVEDPLARVDHTFLYPDADFIGDIDVPVGLVTHCQPFLAQPVLQELDIEDWFDVIVFCNDELGWKPDPAPVERAKQRLGHSLNGNGALVGDSPADIGAAWNAGLAGIHVERHGHDARGCCVRADRRLTTCEELIVTTDY